MADCIFQVAHLPSFQYLFSVLLHVCHTALQFSDKELQALTFARTRRMSSDDSLHAKNNILVCFYFPFRYFVVPLL